MVSSFCATVRDSPVLPNLTDADDYDEKTGSVLVKIAQVARN